MPAGDPDYRPRWLVSPDWLLAGLDTAHDQYQFARVTRATYRDSAFLDHRIRPRPSESRSVKGEDVDHLLAALDPPPAGWIFHTAFCCSTLLSQCLDVDRRTLVLREPGVLSRLAAAVRAPVDTAGETTSRRVLRLVERPYRGERVLVKPSNYANALLPVVLRGEPHATHARKCVLLGSSLRELLLSLLKKQAEAERLLAAFTEALLADSDYRDRVELPPIADLDLLRQGVVFWHCQRYQFQRVRSRVPAEWVLGLTMEAFLDRPVESLTNVSDFLHLGLDGGTVREIVEEGAFRRHAKVGGEYGPEQRRREAEALSARHGEEIRKALNWAEQLVQRLPVEPLLPGEDPLDG